MISFLQKGKRAKEQKGIPVQKLTLEKITKETIIDFLDFLQQTSYCSNVTRNNRLAAIRSFSKLITIRKSGKVI